MVLRRNIWLLAVLGITVPTLAPAGAPGTVEGVVRLEPAKATPVPAQYRVRTRAPIAEPDTPRAIVYLERTDGDHPLVDDGVTILVEQEGYQFRPAMVAVQRGAQVRFPNRDDEFHSVFSYSPAKRFDLGRFRRDEDSPLVTFDEAGLVRVYCEIHKHMRALILVLDTPWFTITDSAGRYTLTGIPAGDYRVHAFLASERTLSGTATVSAGTAVRVDLAP